MNPSRKSIRNLVSVALLLTGGGLAADERIDLSTVHFPPLEGTIAAVAVENSVLGFSHLVTFDSLAFRQQAERAKRELPRGEHLTVDGLEANMRRDAAYVDSLASGNTWWCIGRILNTNAFVEEQADSTERPLEYQLMFRHGGHSWTFWLDFVDRYLPPYRTGELGEEEPDAMRIMGEIETAFAPYLEPVDPAEEARKRQRSESGKGTE